MGTENTAKEQQALVIQVAGKLFGTVILPEQVVTETLERLTQGDEPESSQLVESLINDYSEEATKHWEPGDLQNHLLARWKVITRVEPREFSDQSSLSKRNVVHGYVMPDATGDYSVDDLEAANLPYGWLEPNKGDEPVLKRNYRECLPREVRLRPDGAASPEGLRGWFLFKSFRFCPSCGVEHNVRASEFRKLCGLNSEGWSSATTTLSLAVLYRPLAFPEQEIPDKARKLLAFSDNRQDASLQAGHFNDFVRMLQLRAGLLAALKTSLGQELSLETLAQATEKALRLEASNFIIIKDVKPSIGQSNRRSLRRILGIA